MLYHFLSLPSVCPGMDARLHYQDVMAAGKLQAKTFRQYPQETRSWSISSDPPGDKDYIFLTGRASLHQRAMEMMALHESAHKYDRRTFGLIFNEDSLRYRPGVMYRPHDIAWPDSSPETVPFTDQLVDERCEILVHKELALAEHLIKVIEDGKEKDFTA